jgi:uncharacterized protein
MAKKSGGMSMNTVDWVAWVLVVIGAVNWGLVGLAQINLVDALFGAWPMLVQVVYVLVGLSGLYFVYMALTKK